MIRQIADNHWFARAARDTLTWRALKGRLTASELDRPTLPIALRGLPGPLALRPRATDLKVVWELFGTGEYRPTRPWSFQTVLDCGANVGIFAAYARWRAGPGLGRYIGVEPSPESFALLEEQVRRLGLGPVATLYRAAASDRDGTARFSAEGESWGHRLDDSGTVEVRTMSIGTMLDRAGLDEVDLLKLDIEGGEAAVLGAWPSWSRRVRCLVAELHQVDAPLDYPWFADRAREGGFTPYPAGALFRGHPAAVRDDCLARFGPG